MAIFKATLSFSHQPKSRQIFSEILYMPLKCPKCKQKIFSEVRNGNATIIYKNRCCNTLRVAGAAASAVVFWPINSSNLFHITSFSYVFRFFFILLLLLLLVYWSSHTGAMSTCAILWQLLTQQCIWKKGTNQSSFAFATRSHNLVRRYQMLIETQSNERRRMR